MHVTATAQVSRNALSRTKMLFRSNWFEGHFDRIDSRAYGWLL